MTDVNTALLDLLETAIDGDEESRIRLPSELRVIADSPDKERTHAIVAMMRLQYGPERTA